MLPVVMVHLGVVLMVFNAAAALDLGRWRHYVIVTSHVNIVDLGLYSQGQSPG